MLVPWRVHTLGIVVLTLAGSAGGLSPNIPIPLKGPIG